MTDVTEQKAEHAAGDAVAAADASHEAPPLPHAAEAPAAEAAAAEHGAEDLAGAGPGATHDAAAPAALGYDLTAAELERAFHAARTPRAWTARPVAEETLQHLYDLMKLGPTSANCAPARLVFLKSREAREKLRPALTPGNLDGVMKAPVTIIVAYDSSFYDFLPRLYPQAEDARDWFAWNHDFAQETALRNGSLQGGYLILAARLLGLDCWPMSGFDNARVDTLFLDGRGWRSNFLLNIGYAEPVEGPRNPRLMFEEACEIL
ncbi:malonic semialdehyde reductase [Acidisoma sp. C75]